MILGVVVVLCAAIVGIIGLYLFFKNMKTVIAWCKKSLEDPATGNASSKRLSGVWMMVLITLLHIVWLKKAFMTGEFALLPEILWADLAFVVAALGISAWQTTATQKPKEETPTQTA